MGGTAEYAVKMHHVTKTFGKVIANKDVNLELKTGEILALLGENGSGKTTLMNMLSGIYFPDQPIVSLYVKSMMTHGGDVAFVAGVVAATPGLGTLIAASRIGHKIDEVGPLRVLRIGLVVGAVLFAPMALTNSPWVLAGLRFLLGIASAGMLPAAQTVLTLNTPSESFGRIFSYNQSFQAVGAVLGSLMGSTISGFSNYATVFWVTGFTLLINFVLVLIFAWGISYRNR